MSRNLKVKSILAGSALLAGLGVTSVFAQQAGRPMDDASLVAQVRAALEEDRWLKGSEIKVESNDGRIKLYGLATRAHFAQAYRVAISVPGVKSVANLIFTTDNDR